jgi:hypothetical protein
VTPEKARARIEGAFVVDRERSMHQVPLSAFTSW